MPQVSPPLVPTLLAALLATPAATAAPAAPSPGARDSPDAHDLSSLDPASLDPASLDPDALDRMLEDAAGRSDGPRVPLSWEAEALAPPAPPVPDKEPAGAPAVGPPSAPVDHPGEAAGFLSGRAVYLSQCHGWIWYDSLGRFSTQRGNLFDTVEDFHNPEGASQYLARYLENAGARVYTAKERDLNPDMAIADNDGEGYTEAGAGFTDGPAGFADQGAWDYGENPFDAGTTRRLPADGGAVATWTPEVPADGVYAVYVSWDSASDNATAAHYRITHPGGVIDRTFDQTVHGSTWQYVERLWLPAGVGGLTVELVGDGAESGRWLSADAVRIGGGTGDVRRNGGTTGKARWEEGAILYTQYNGAPTSVYDPYGDGDGSDPSSRSRWAAWEHPSGESAVYLSWHSNAGGGTGTSTYIYEGSYDPVPHSSTLGHAVQDELIGAITALWDGDWVNRGVRTATFSEINPVHNDEMPAALVELAFHDNSYDTELLKDPAFRRDAARAMYRGIARTFAEMHGEAPAFLPEPPLDVALLHDASGSLELSWAPGPAGDPFGDAPEGYVVYRSADGRSWDGGTDVGDVTSAILVAAPGQTVFARVAARNAGGLSFPSEVVGARRSPAGVAEVLVVAGFDRLRASNLPWRDAGGSVGMVRHMDLPRVNGFDGVAAHGRAVAAAGWYFESAADEVLGDLDLSRNRVVLWNAGEESSEDTTITAAQQAQLRSFQAAGGALWVSGAEVLWDLDHRGDAADRAFAAEALGAAMEADDAGTTEVTGEGLLDGLLLDFAESDGAPYPVEYPDVLATEDAVLARYSTGGVAASMAEGRALFGFPFETIGDEAVRGEVAARLLPALVPGHEPPDPDGGGDTGGDTADPGGDDTGAHPDTPSGGQAPGDRVPLGGGCGCGGGALPAAAWWVALVAAASRRRRA